ncbi:hypothetical protein, partial [Mycobacterium tuberculosis]|uniref:hypothetical protein n=1 Tax=Mycobacterium tuberculosis TaxID=1773 RepID=UPI001BE3EA2E
CGTRDERFLIARVAAMAPRLGDTAGSPFVVKSGWTTRRRTPGAPSRPLGPSRLDAAAAALAARSAVAAGAA